MLALQELRGLLAIEERSFDCVSRLQKPQEKQNRAKLRSG
jgi:hypothetical protein